MRVLEELGLEDEIPVAALAKQFEEVWLPGRAEPVRIPRQSDALYLLQRIRDEAHRFAITYHRQLRDKRMTKSVLDDIPGLGPGRRKRLDRGARRGQGGEGGVVGQSCKRCKWLPDAVAAAVHARRSTVREWEATGGVVAGELHRRGRRRVRRADHPDGGRARRRVRTGARCRLRRGPAGAGHRRDRHRPGVAAARGWPASGAVSTPGPLGRGIAVRRRRLRRGDRLSGVRAHRRRAGAIAEVGRVLQPGGRFLFFLNHPLLQTPGSGWIDDHILEEQYWRIGPYLIEDTTLEEVDKGVFLPFVHRPLSRYVNLLAATGLYITHMEEPAPPPGFLARAPEYTDAATIPRLLFLRTEKR